MGKTVATGGVLIPRSLIATRGYTIGQMDSRAIRLGADAVWEEQCQGKGTGSSIWNSTERQYISQSLWDAGENCGSGNPLAFGVMPHFGRNRDGPSRRPGCFREGTCSMPSQLVELPYLRTTWSINWETQTEDELDGEGKPGEVYVCVCACLGVCLKKFAVCERAGCADGSYS